VNHPDQTGASGRVGACEFTLTLQPGAVHWGEEVHGTVSLRLAGRAAPPFRVERCEAYLLTDYGLAVTPLAATHWGPVVLDSSATPYQPFALPVEWGASEFGKAGSVGCRVTLPGLMARTATAQVKFRVLPPRTAMDLAQLLQEDGLLALRFWELTPEGRGFTARFEPVDPRAAVPSLQLEGMLVRGRQRYTLVVPSASGPGRHVPLLIRTHACEELRQIVASLSPLLYYRSILPVPADGPRVDPAALPRPSGALAEHGDRLPRPAQAEERA
jgi:hypothetical protein